ncbi:MAG: hypothetical protein A3B91_03395 [Candidatus Yanofskybacteria bacterium RIFCSPHIGHO2_02_FULL_41_29]|uniref:TVP38/TMEM64 family membrane protein n=1 Tax=Candidatus Yanofskybacteria bacterium RIFCSPHIGHO2_01_FULL_41_53 TaxID=1802663 RepID=A0A1F8EJ01_9BACT|nr:MAG: hypothetical protein A2650_01220 [Candidatus Yanofskybacteria bacterium RIFCSPHIGHO2_01_FULL_41_53]OGN10706.1 MAG: hypothetical protein A3B91_03395 [Candidatus Yanofskybacteria bacterium RIFCSPHIGHO2_02_FULL_41_29]OGN18786.1 MAG: hypothetical protein A3F48_02455 [Candidatus Yanofskybacteria bacterium RIFCSPHIGHO2_12_FULL_41_9]OGN24036.1 MAG: hypothetical protein A2916_04735 [Candidatus Yanofskybacteria bacterium RIFCSPLOWO2_01_FULL_41_67]OGN30504.1 MAG: hypothetical protein A3H54_00565 
MNNGLIRDMAIVILSILIAIILAETGALESLITSTQEVRFIGSFIAGILFVSVFTAAPATIALGEIAQSNSVITVALIGGLGALIGDLLIFRFVKDKLSEDLLNLIKTSKSERLTSMTKIKGLKWVVPLIGALIIASPLPDEIGIAMLGLSKMKNSLFIPLSFALNSAGILVIGLISKAV